MIPDPNLSCNMCNMKFEKIQFLKKHINSHARNVCEFCDQDFARRRALVIHMKKEHKVNYLIHSRHFTNDYISFSIQNFTNIVIAL